MQNAAQYLIGVYLLQRVWKYTWIGRDKTSQRDVNEVTFSSVSDLKVSSICVFCVENIFNWIFKNFSYNVLFNVNYNRDILVLVGKWNTKHVIALHGMIMQV